MPSLSAKPESWACVGRAKGEPGAHGIWGGGLWPPAARDLSPEDSPTPTPGQAVVSSLAGLESGTLGQQVGDWGAVPVQQQSWEASTKDVFMLLSSSSFLLSCFPLFFIYFNLFL